MGLWLRVTRTDRCPVCGADGWCTRSPDGEMAKCMRVESSKPAKGNGWIHRLDSPAPFRLPPRETPRAHVDFTATARRMFEAGEGARRELAPLLGVSLDSLERLRVGTGSDTSCFTSWPERDATGAVVGIVRRYLDGRKLHMPGGSHGLYLPEAWSEATGPVLLPEGGSDTAALLTMGLSAIGRPSCTSGVDKLATVLKATNRAVVVLGESDRKPGRVGTVASCPTDCDGCSWCWPGKYGARITAERLTAALGRRVYWRMVPDTKDAREWLKLNGCDGAAFLDELRRQAAQL